MIGFFLRALGLATLLYFVFVLPIGRKTLAQEAAVIWEQTHLRHALEVSGTHLRRELTLKLRAWQAQQSHQSEQDSDTEAARRIGEDDTGVDSDQNADAAAPPTRRPSPSGRRSRRP